MTSSIRWVWVWVGHQMPEATTGKCTVRQLGKATLTFPCKRRGDWREQRVPPSHTQCKGVGSVPLSALYLKT